MGAVLGKRLALSIVGILDINKEFITFWTDSTSVMWWERGYSRQYNTVYYVGSIGRTMRHVQCAT